MSGQRSLSFLSIAQQCADRGEKGRAIITVVNALRNHPECIDTEPASVDFLAEIYINGFEEEFNRLRMGNPHFWDQFAESLTRAGKTNVVAKLQTSFEKYCIEQMKMTHASYGAQPRPMYQHNAAYPQKPTIMPMPQGMQNGVCSALGDDVRLMASRPAPRSSQQLSHVVRASSSNGFTAIAHSPNASAFGNTQFDVFTHADRSLMDALELGVPDTPQNLSPSPVTSMEFDGMRIPLDDTPMPAVARVATIPSLELQAHDEPVNMAVTPKFDELKRPTPLIQNACVEPDAPQAMPNFTESPQNTSFASLNQAAQQAIDLDTDMISKVALSSVNKRHAENTDAPTPLTRRFDRLRAKTKSTKSTEVYTDDNMARVIYDFDDKIGSSLISSGERAFTELTPVKTYEQELAEFRASSANFPKVIRVSELKDPFEELSIVSAELDENIPKVDPLEPVPSVTFSITPKQLSICVVLCAIVVLCFITWKINAPNLEREAMVQLASTYFDDAQKGINRTENTTQAEESLATAHFASNIQTFLDVWSAKYFTGHEDFVFDEKNSLTHPSEVTAYIMWLTDNGRLEDAKNVYADTSRDTWRGAEDFRKFAEAVIAESEHDDVKAASRFAKLANSSLRSFALSRLGLLAIRSNHPDVRSIYENLAYSEDEPFFSKCTRALFTHGQVGIEPEWQFGTLKPEYANLCGIAASMRRIQLGLPTNIAWTRYLESMEVDETLAQYRLEVLIDHAMASGDVKTAATWFAKFETSPYHPDRTQLQHEIIQRAFDVDSLSALTNFDRHVSDDLTSLEAARILDTNQFEATSVWANYATRYNFKRPTATLPGVTYEDSMNTAWENAVDGHYTAALSELKALRNRAPNAWEPLMLQAEVLYHANRAQEAAGLYEFRAMQGEGGYVAIVMSNLYRTRAKLTPNPMVYGLFWTELNDPTLESARCEILENLEKRDEASICQKNLAKRKLARPVKTAWMTRNARHASQADLVRAGTGAMSPKGYHRQLARLKMANGAPKEGFKAYENAILFDPATATVETIQEMEKEYEVRKRLYEGAHAFEDLIQTLKLKGARPELIAAAHHAAAAMYQPQKGSSQAKQHLIASINLIGDNERALTGIVQYYKAKDNAKQLATWQARLKQFRAQHRQEEP